MSFSINTQDAPAEAMRCGPQIGDVYKKDGGPAGFMLIVSDNGSTYHYILFAPDGQITGVGQSNSYYFSRRCFVGRVEEMPPLSVEWFR